MRSDGFIGLVITLVVAAVLVAAVWGYTNRPTIGEDDATLNPQQSAEMIESDNHERAETIDQFLTD